MVDRIGSGGPAPVASATVTVDSSGGATDFQTASVDLSETAGNYLAVPAVADTSNLASGSAIRYMNTVGNVASINANVRYVAGTGFQVAAQAEANATTGPVDVEVTVYEVGA